MLTRSDWETYSRSSVRGWLGILRIPSRAAGCKAKVPLLGKLAVPAERIAGKCEAVLRFVLRAATPGVATRPVADPQNTGTMREPPVSVWNRLDPSPGTVFGVLRSSKSVWGGTAVVAEGWGTASGSCPFTAPRCCSAGVVGDWSSKCQQFPWTNAILLFKKAQAQTMHHPASQSNAEAEPSLLFAFNQEKE